MRNLTHNSIQFAQWRRIVSFVLAMALFVSAGPMPALSVESSGDASAQNFSANIGNTAEFAGYFPTPVTDAPENVNNPFGTECQQIFTGEVPTDLLLVIVDYYYNEVKDLLWYKVEAAPGYTMPDKLVQYPWVFHDNVDASYGAGSLIIHNSGKNFVFDAEGNPLTQVTLPQYGKQSVTAETTLQGDVSYQWQIEYAPDQWVDIYGTTYSYLTLSYGMVAGLLDENNTVHVRCKSTSGNKEVYSDVVPVRVEIPEPVTPSVNVTLNGQPVSEITISVSDKVTLNAAMNVADSVVSYRWQLYITSVDMWVNISGQNTAECTVNYGMVAGRLDANGQALVRCVATMDGEEIIGEPIAVNVVSAANDARMRRDGGIMPRAEGDGGVIKHTIEIKYVFTDGTTAAQSVIYEVVHGEDITIERTHPTVLGYLPYENEVDQKNQFVQTFTDVQSDVTIIITYKPTNVNYTVIHYWQNVHDDGYVEHERQTLQGLTNSDVGNVALTYNGFYVLLYEHPKIAADGSTVVEVYYDRYYYLMFFDCNGGYGVEPMYARYETPINIGTPTRPGWNFAGWNPAVPAAVPTEDRNFTAQWTQTGNRRYTIVYWAADLDDGDPNTEKTYSYFGKKEVWVDHGTTLVPVTIGQNNPATDVVIYGRDLTGDEEYLDETLYYEYDRNATQQKNPASVVVADDNSTIINVYYSRKIFEIRYVYARSYDTTTTRPGRPPTTTTTRQIATLTYNGVLGNWQLRNVDSLPTVKAGSGFTEKSEVVRQNGRDYTYYYISLRAEYGANIESQWPGAAINSVNGMSFGSWAAQDGTHYRGKDPDHANIVGPYPYMSAEMIRTADVNQSYQDGQQKYYVAQRMSAWWNGSIENHTYHIYLEVKKGETPDRKINGKEYKLFATHNFQCAHNGSTRVDPFFYTGYECVNDTRGENGNNLNSDTDYQRNSVNYENTWDNRNAGRYDCPNNSCKYCNCFYYDRIDDIKLLFMNQGSEIHVDQMTFGDLLQEGVHEDWDETNDHEPMYPSTLEPGGYEFTGWYTTPECYEGTKVDWDEDTMPPNDLILYAGWKPVTHTVEVYMDGTLSQLIEGPVLVTHGQKFPEGQIPGTPDHPNDLEFVLWFYRDENGEEIAFDFANMPVNRDMKIYAKWTSNILVDYEFRFEDASGNPVAAPVIGSGLVGSTKTQSAKGDMELYEPYRLSWFPNVMSHSIVLDVNESNNVFIFRYTEVAQVPYTVHYYKEGTTQSVSSSKTVADNRKAVVVETFVPVSGYLPDAVTKKLVVTPDGENVIIFYYKENITQSYYKVTHYIKNLEGDGYMEYTSTQNLVNNGVKVKADPITISGFTFGSDHPNNVTSGTVEQGKLLELKLYYDRVSYPYEIRWVDKTTRIPLQESVKGTALFGATISGDAASFLGYTLVSETPQNMVIRVESGNDAVLNVITFEYDENQATIHYVVSGGGGTVSPTTETNKVATGLFYGSTPTPAENYKFVGWFTDAACTIPVDASWVDVNGKITPRKNAQGLYESATYYAKFEYQITSLTITKSGMQDGDHSLFHITGNGVDLIVSIQGNGSVTVNGLQVGKEYTVTELTDWSWKYQFVSVSNGGSSAQVVHMTGQAAATVTLATDKNTVVFDNTSAEPDWLGGEVGKENVFN